MQHKNVKTAVRFEDILRATQRISHIAHRTAVVKSSYLDQAYAANIFFKCENFQRTGSFKFRGAYNALAQFNDAQRQAGVVAFSSGNHAQSIALAAKMLNIPATIVMPKDAPIAKITATQAYGAAVIFYDRYTQNREQIAQEFAYAHAMTLIPAYDHPDIIAGQATAVKELIEEVGELDVLLIGLGGGGLLAGGLIAVKAMLPNCLVYGVEPEMGNDGQMSLKAGKIMKIDVPNTIADGAQTQYLGQLTFPIIQENVTDILTVDDRTLIAAMQFFAQYMKQVLEPTACLATAALPQLKAQLQGKRVGVMLTGGNIDLAQYGQMLQRPSMPIF